MHSAFLIHICWTVIYPVNGIIQCLSIRGQLVCENWKKGNSPFVSYFQMILWISVEHAFPFPFRSLNGLSQWRIKYNIFCHHTSYCNIMNNQDELQKPAKNQNVPSVEEIRVLYSHFQSCVPSACPELHCKKKIIITLHACICTYHTISKLSLFRFLLCYVQVSLTFALFLKAVNNLDF